MGTDPVSDQLLKIHDGPFLELGLKGIAGTLIDRPRRLEDRPDRDRLALRFEQFKKAAWLCGSALSSRLHGQES
jgi:putative restriction endonuclease